MWIVTTCSHTRSGAKWVTLDCSASRLTPRTADQAVLIGGSAPADSYLRGDRIIEAALATGADAIHPGYGFLSENADFVDAVAQAGLIFVGPSADAIRTIGLKDAAKSLMAKACVPIVPGYHGEAQDALGEEAAKIGYPVMIKAVAGGGGKGMRLVETPDAFDAALASAQSEARTSFSNDAVLIEKYIAQPRHIEVQIFGDGADVVHLFERDCSLQRRHQKVIEEAPAPNMPDAVRQAMCDTAVRAGRAINYSGAGTVEFIVDGTGPLHDDGFWFMEMNTRLQVEHPVTEGVTGLDLVEWQLRIAGGDALPKLQDEITCTGHAIEARVYAEDPVTGFLPAIGQLDLLEFGQCRADTGVRQGDEITPWYDPMIAKMIVHSPDRAQALAQIDRALGESKIVGVATNVGFLKRLVGQAEFAAGQVDTGLIARNLDVLTQAAEPCTKTQAIAAVASLECSQTAHQGFALWTSAVKWVRLSADTDVAVVVLRDGLFECLGYKVKQIGTGWVIDGSPVAAQTHVAPTQIAVFWGATYRFDRLDPLDVDSSEIAGSGQILSPMPGCVTSISVGVGDQVENGATLLTVEAMKMKHTLRASIKGVVQRIDVAIGDQVAAKAVLLVMEPEGGS